MGGPFFGVKITNIGYPSVLCPFFRFPDHAGKKISWFTVIVYRSLYVRRPFNESNPVSFWRSSVILLVLCSLLSPAGGLDVGPAGGLAVGPAGGLVVGPAGGLAVGPAGGLAVCAEGGLAVAPIKLCSVPSGELYLERLGRGFKNLLPVFRICDILVRIRIHLSILLTNGSGSGSGSCFFFVSDLQDASFFAKFFLKVLFHHS